MQIRLCTWNINSVRLRLDLLSLLVKNHQPDVIMLQETKVEDKSFPQDAICDMGYKYQHYRGQKSYNGVAILSKIPIDDTGFIEIYNDDKRHVCAKIAGLNLHNFYVPAGGDEPDVEVNPKFKHKLEYIAGMQEYLREFMQGREKLVIAGDFNIAPQEQDVWSSRQLRNVVSHTNQERLLLSNLQEELGFIDTGRFFTPEPEKLYSWWSYRNKDWQKSNRGRRLDHIWISPYLSKSLIATDYLKEARNWPRPSDHIPIILDVALDE